MTYLIAAAIVAALFLAVFMVVSLRAKREDARRMKARRVRNRAHQYAWDLVMGRKRHLRLTDARDQDEG